MNTKKTLVAVIATLLVAATLPCFAKGKVVTQWKGKAGGDEGIITFYSDKTFELWSIDEDGGVYGAMEGTYAGDTTKDGKISITLDGSSGILEIVGDALDFAGRATFTKVKK